MNYIIEGTVDIEVEFAGQTMVLSYPADMYTYDEALAQAKLDAAAMGATIK